jgi:hypothetical protein
MEIIPCGTKAQTKSGLIDAIITATKIRFNSVTYELSYFHDGKYEVVWLDESEFFWTPVARLRIGFKTHE